MQFKETYLRAMREQAPQMFNDLRKTGAMESHLQRKTEEAYALYRQLTAGAEKLPNGEVKDPQVRHAAEEQVLATLVEFAPA